MKDNDEHFSCRRSHDNEVQPLSRTLFRKYVGPLINKSLSCGLKKISVWETSETVRQTVGLGRYLTMSVRLLRTASWSNVVERPSPVDEKTISFRSAPLSSSSSTTSLCPHLTASWAGVLPASHRALTVAPIDSSSRARRTSPAELASCRAVDPSMRRAFTSAPQASRTAATRR